MESHIPDNFFPNWNTNFDTIDFGYHVIWDVSCLTLHQQQHMRSKQHECISVSVSEVLYCDRSLKIIQFYSGLINSITSEANSHWSTQQLATGPYPEPEESSPHPPPFSLRFILILFTPLRLGLPRGLFPSGFLTKNCKHFSFLPRVLHDPPTSFSLTWSP